MKRAIFGALLSTIAFFPLSALEKPVIEVNKSEITFENPLNVGSEDYAFLSVNLKNASSGAKVSHAIEGADANCFFLTEGTFSWSIYFKPVSAGVKVATLKLTADGADPVLIPLKGTGKVSNVTVTLSPDTGEFDFGSVPIGTFSAPRQIAITITDAPADTEITLAGDDKGHFYKTGGYLDYEGQTTVTLMANPKAEGAKRADLLIKAGSLERRVVLKVTGVNPNAPQIMTDLQAINFGEVFVGKSTERELVVVLKNSGSAIQTSIRSDGHGEFSVQGSLVPNSGGKLTVTYAPKIVGSKSVELVIRDGSVEKIVPITASARIWDPKITTNVSELQLEDTNIGDTSESREIEVSLSDITVDPVISFEGAAASMFSATPTTLPHDLTTARIAIAFAPKQSGLQEVKLVIRSGEIRAVVLVRAKGLEKAIPTLTTDPAILDFGEVRLGEYYSESLRILVKNTNEIPVATIDGADKDLFNIVSQPSKEDLSVKVGFLPTSVGKKTANLRLSLSGGIEHVVKVCALSTAPDPVITADREEIIFGNIEVGRESAAMGISLRLENLSEDVTVEVIGDDAASFIPSRKQIGRESEDGFISVVFKPASLGGKTATLRFSSGDANVQVRLIGNAVPAGIESVSSDSPLSWRVVSGGILLDFHRPGNLLSIYDQSGKLIVRECPGQGEHRYGLAPGVYLIGYGVFLSKVLIF